MARSVTGNGPHPVDRHVGRRVCEKRIALGYTQSALADALGLTFQQVQKYEKGANRISASKLWDIAAFFKVRIGYFFEGLEDGVEDGTVAPLSEFPLTRATAEIVNLAPRLSVPRQKLVVDLLRGFVGHGAPADQA